MIPGIDVSHWQDDKSTPQKMNFEKAKDAGAQFVFIKVSERGSIDRDYEYNWESAKFAGLLRGGYHYLRWDLPAVTQARIFCAVMKSDPGELPPVADFEAPPYGIYKPSAKFLLQFLIEVESITGRVPIVYTSRGFWSSYGNTDQMWKYFPLWIAHYTSAASPKLPKPWDSFLFWQYGVFPRGLEFGAESKLIDLDWYNGSLISLFALACQGTLQPTPSASPDVTVRVANLEYKFNQFVNCVKKIGTNS